MPGKGPMTVADVVVGMGKGATRRAVTQAMNALLARGAIEETGIESRFAKRWWCDVCTSALGRIKSRRSRYKWRVGPDSIVGIHPSITGARDDIAVLRYLLDRGLVTSDDVTLIPRQPKPGAQAGEQPVPANRHPKGLPEDYWQQLRLEKTRRLASVSDRPMTIR